MSGVTTATVIGYGIAAAGAAVSVYSALSQGKQAEAMADYQNQQAQVDASVVQSQGELEARRIRQAGERQRSTARAALANSGVTLSTGSAEQIEQKITRGAEEDALLAIYEGNTKADQIRSGGNAAKIQGANAKKAGQLNAFSSALGSASKAWSGYQKAA